MIIYYAFKEVWIFWDI